MQRNIFGHAIYQIIVLIVIIFCAPGWLCEPYWNRCVNGGVYINTESNEQEDNCEWNPFYADGPYYLTLDSGEGHESGEAEGMDPVFAEWWAKKNLTPDKYNADVLKRFSCSAHIAKNPEVPMTIDECVDQGVDVEEKTPDKMEAYDETQQIIHYTLVF